MEAKGRGPPGAAPRRLSYGPPRGPPRGGPAQRPGGGGRVFIITQTPARVNSAGKDFGKSPLRLSGEYSIIKKRKKTLFRRAGRGPGRTGEGGKGLVRRRAVTAALWALVLALALGAAGCSADVDGLLSIPGISPEHERLLALVDAEASASGWSVTAPAGGENLSAMQFVDFFGDGISEAVTFFRDPARMRLCVMLWVRTGSTGYAEMCRIETDGSGVEEIVYEDLDGDGADEVVLTVGYESRALIGVEAYRIRNDAAEPLFRAVGTACAVTDLMGDGRKELLVCRETSAGEGGPGAELIRFGAAGAESLGTAPISFAARPEAVVSGEMGEGMRVCVLDGTVERGGEVWVSDVLTWSEEGGLRNVTFDEEQGCAWVTARAERILCRDADLDGYLEFPQCAAMPAPPDGAADEKPGVYTLWFSAGPDGAAKQKAAAYCDPEGLWYFLLPDSWRGSVYVRRTALPGVGMVYFVSERNGRPNLLLTVYRVAEGQRPSAVGREDFLTSCRGYDFYSVLAAPDLLDPLEEEMYLSLREEVSRRFVAVDSFGVGRRASAEGEEGEP